MQFGDLRGWIAQLKKEGELHEVNTEVDWDCELGTVTRRAFGNGDGPALLFSNIKDYQHNARCTKLFTGGLSNYSRVAMMFGLPKNAPDHRAREGGASRLCRPHSAGDGRDRAGQAEHPQRRRHRPLRFSRCRAGTATTAGATSTPCRAR